MKSPVYIRAGVNLDSTYDPYQAIAYGALGSNLGNMLFQLSVWNTISSDYAKAVPIGHDLHYRQAGQINEHGRALILPLANLFRNEFLSKIDEYAELIEKLKVPVVVVGVGCQADLNYSFDLLKPIEKSVKRFVRAVLDRSASIGVRGECTYNYLKSLGVSDLEVIGCPSMYMYGGKLPDIKSISLDANTRFALNISSPIQQCEFSKGVETAASFMESIYYKFPKSMFFPQEQRTLEMLLYKENIVLDEFSYFSDKTKFSILKNQSLNMFFDPRSWIGFLKNFDVSFGTRIHGNIASILAGVASVVFAHDSRTLELCNFHRIPFLRFDSSLDLDALADLANNGIKNIQAIHEANYYNYCSFLIKNGISPAHKDTDFIRGGKERYISIENNLAQHHFLWNAKYSVKVRRLLIRQMRKRGKFNV